MPTNIWQLPPHLDTEFFEILCQNPSVLVERIVSFGQATPAGQWYDQDRHEWVVLLQGNATLLFDSEQGEIVLLQAGSHIHIPPHRLHRVTYTSTEPPCIWLAVHFS